MGELVFLVSAKNYDIANQLLNDLSNYDCKYQLIDSESSGYEYNDIFSSKVNDITDINKHKYKADVKQSNRIGNILSSYGLSSTNLGFTYAIDAIKLMNAYGINNYSMTADIYPGVADLHKVTSMSVEHNIRNSIYKAWTSFENGDLDNAGISLFKRRPSNKKFLEHIAKKSNYIMAEFC